MDIRADVMGEHGLDTVMLIAELDVYAAINATSSQVDTAIALIKRMKHAFEVPQLLHDPGFASAIRTAQLNLNVVMKNTFLHLRLWCSEKERMRELDDLCRYMTERHLSKYVSSTRVNSCESFSGVAEVHEAREVLIKFIMAIERHLKPESLIDDSDCRSDSTLSIDDVVPSAESPEYAPPAVATYSHVGDAYSPRMWRGSPHGTELYRVCYLARNKLSAQNLNSFGNNKERRRLRPWRARRHRDQLNLVV
eukprot:6172128-Pleurochrysis_carterae.AAC.5